MKRLTQAPNVALATLWADLLNQAGMDAVVQRAYTSGIAGEIPPDQALPEVWVMDDSRVDAARQLLHQLCSLPWTRWPCHGCGEQIDGPFEQCWNCGAMRPT